jgi:light-regulated signal transduction histidine kinase (bacteriophytochrome)
MKQKRHNTGTLRTGARQKESRPLEEGEDSTIEASRQNGELSKLIEELQQSNVNLEGQLRGKEAQLTELNKELDAFAFSVSHDLRAPLRSIRGFSEVLLERYNRNLDERGQEFLRRLCHSSEQMDLLIKDLLRLSRVTRVPLEFQTVNLSALTETIAGELRAASPDRAVDLVITPELIVRGDEHLLREVLDNLIRNAWRFTSSRNRGRIEFGRDAGLERAFFVRDNGIGFDMANAGKLFGIFQRMQTQSEMPGTGVGLAIVRRIVNRHGGRTWGTGEVNKGAVFYFTIPDNP